MLGRKVTRRFCSFPVVFLYCNLASMGSIQQFVQAFKKKKLPLHVLVNNGEFRRIPEGSSEANTESRERSPLGKQVPMEIRGRVCSLLPPFHLKGVSGLCYSHQQF